MIKLPIEEDAFDLVCAADRLYYRLLEARTFTHRFFTYDLRQKKEIAETAFNCAKYRAPVKPFIQGEEVVFLPNGNTLRCFYQDTRVREFSPSGRLLRVLPDALVAGDAIYSLALDQQGHLWTAEPCFHYVGHYDVASAERLYSVGGSWDEGEFNLPEDISVYDETVFISDMGHQRLVTLDIPTKRLHTYRSFDQPVWQYRRFNQREIVRLQDGFYFL